MALTPEDVIKKSFNATHLRRGYDESQVDDFLDEVVVELRRLLSESDDLRSQLEDCRASKGLDTAGDVSGAGVIATGGADADAEADRLRAEREQLEAELAELREQVAAAQREAEEAEAREVPATAEGAVADDGGPVVATAAGDPGEGTPRERAQGIIALAERLHDEHVAEGEATRDRLVSEAHTYRDTTVAEADQRSRELVETGQQRHDELVRTGQERHDELVRTGQERHDELVSTAERRRREVLADLEVQQEAMHGKIEELTSFEHDYRVRMRSFIIEHLDILDRDGSSGGSPVAEGAAP